MEEIIDKICVRESRVAAEDEDDALLSIKDIRAAGKLTTHIVPHYHVVSAPVSGYGLLTGAVSATRKFFIESLYRRVSTMFPETINWEGSQDEMMRVGINAQI